MTQRRLSKHKILDKLSEESKLRMQKEINSCSEVFDFLLGILQSRHDQLQADLLSKSLYESPAYAYKVADLSGGIREVSSLMKLLQETEE